MVIAVDWNGFSALRMKEIDRDHKRPSDTTTTVGGSVAAKGLFDGHRRLLNNFFCFGGTEVRNRNRIRRFSTHIITTTAAAVVVLVERLTPVVESVEIVKCVTCSGSRANLPPAYIC